MGKFLLLTVAAVSLATGILTMTSTRESMGHTGDRLGERADDSVARAVAHSGMAVAESALAVELAATGTYSGPTTFAAPYQGGAYAVTLTAAGDEYTVFSEGRAGADTSRVQTVYRFERGGGSAPPAPGPVPPFMAPSMLIGNSLHVSDDFTIRSEDPTANATLHANNSIHIRGGAALVTGFGTVGNSIKYQRGNSEASVFRPNANPDGRPLTENVPKVDVPRFDAEAHRSLATRETPGDLTLSGTVTLGTREAPVIWYVGNSVRTDGDVTIEGYGTFIVNNSIHITDSIRGAAGTGGESTVGFYTGNSIHIQGDGGLEVAGQFLIGNSFHADAGVSIRGSMTVGNSIHLGGPFTSIYRPATSVLTDPFWPPDPTDAAPTPAPEFSGGERLVTVSTRVW